MNQVWPVQWVLKEHQVNQGSQGKPVNKENGVQRVMLDQQVLKVHPARREKLVFQVFLDVMENLSLANLVWTVSMVNQGSPVIMVFLENRDHKVPPDRMVNQV